MIGYITPVLKAARRGARLDTWSVVPPLGAMMVLADLFVFLPKDRRGLQAMLSMGAAVGAVAFAVVAFGWFQRPAERQLGLVCRATKPRSIVSRPTRLDWQSNLVADGPSSLSFANEPL